MYIFRPGWFIHCKLDEFAFSISKTSVVFFCFSKQNYTASEIISVDRSDVVRLERRRISYENKSCKYENPTHDETVGLKFLRTHDTCQKKLKQKKLNCDSEWMKTGGNLEFTWKHSTCKHLFLSLNRFKFVYYVFDSPMGVNGRPLMHRCYRQSYGISSNEKKFPFILDISFKVIFF